MNAYNSLKKYQDVEVETKVYGADAHKLVLLLYQGALLSIAAAKNHLLMGESHAKGKSIAQAISIIEDGLKASLDLKVGELATNLASLYGYMATRLIHANLNDDVIALDEVARLLIDLRSAWEAIRPGTEPEPAPAQAVQEGVSAPRPVVSMPRASPGIGSPQPASVSRALNAYLRG